MNYLSQPKADRDGKFPKLATAESRPGATPVSGKLAPEMVTTFGHGMLITGNIVCAGAMQIFGRVIGEIRASHLIISEGAVVEGKIMAQEAIIQGTFKGTIHGSSVKLQGTAVVEGEIYNKSLTIEQNALFEGMSRRLDRPVEAPSMQDITSDALTPVTNAYAATVAPKQTNSSETDLDHDIIG